MSSTIIGTGKYSIRTRRTPGNAMVIVARCETITEARKVASEYDHRRDLARQDVVIEWTDSGRRIEFAGPAR